MDRNKTERKKLQFPEWVIYHSMYSFMLLNIKTGSGSQTIGIIDGDSNILVSNSLFRTNEG